VKAFLILLLALPLLLTACATTGSQTRTAPTRTTVAQNNRSSLYGPYTQDPFYPSLGPGGGGVSR
jgi:hypothetical protein